MCDFILSDLRDVNLKRLECNWVSKLDTSTNKVDKILEIILEWKMIFNIFTLVSEADIVLPLRCWIFIILEDALDERNSGLRA